MKRYEMSSYMSEHRGGEWVWIKDHEAEIAQLREALEASRMPHYTCDDKWYSCPKAPDGCLDRSEGSECNCGADAHNARIDAALNPEVDR
jgi:hypothetical protein